MPHIRGVSIREGSAADWKPALELAWNVYNEYDAGDYSPEGTENFRKFLEDDTLEKMFLMGSYRLFVAGLYGRIVGMLTLREKAHISLLFVDGNCQGNGIGSALVRMAAGCIGVENRGNVLTVHSSPRAVGFYGNLGFRVTGEEKFQDGIRFTPMELRLG